jgi:hypothetical protein
MPTKNKEIMARNSRKNYLRHREAFLERAKARNIRLRMEAREVVRDALSVGCVDCGEADIIVLDFDHVDRKTKCFTISGAIRTRVAIPKLKAEIAKCVVRCANCHRRKTANENGSWRILGVVSGEVTEQPAKLNDEGSSPSHASSHQFEFA